MSFSQAGCVTHEDGTEMDLGPGDAYVIEPGHDAWVVGDDAFVGFEFESRSAEEYARCSRSCARVITRLVRREIPAPHGPHGGWAGT